MKLEEGMYVKYTRGAINGYVPPRIAKITDCSDKDLIKIDNGQVILKADILKASNNIIDLIEEGDYVNGILVKTIWERNNDCIFFYIVDDEIMFQITNKTIENIVTREQFESIAYEVGE